MNRLAHGLELNRDPWLVAQLALQKGEWNSYVLSRPFQDAIAALYPPDWRKRYIAHFISPDKVSDAMEYYDHHQDAILVYRRKKTRLCHSSPITTGNAVRAAIRTGQYGLLVGISIRIRTYFPVEFYRLAKKTQLRIYNELPLDDKSRLCAQCGMSAHGTISASVPSLIKAYHTTRRSYFGDKLDVYMHLIRIGKREYVHSLSGRTWRDVPDETSKQLPLTKTTIQLLARDQRIDELKRMRFRSTHAICIRMVGVETSLLFTK